MSPARKSAAKSTSGKRSSGSATTKRKKAAGSSSSRKSKAKAPARKAPAKSDAKKKAPGSRRAATKAKQRAAAPAPEPKKSARRSGRRRSSKRSQSASLAPATGGLPTGKPGLGHKWVCYSCGAKFYDLGRSEPVCPRCSTDQHTRPKSTTEAPAPAPRRPAAPPMSRFLDDDEAPPEEFDEDVEDEAAELDIESLEDTVSYIDTSDDED